MKRRNSRPVQMVGACLLAIGGLAVVACATDDSTPAGVLEPASDGGSNGDAFLPSTTADAGADDAVDGDATAPSCGQDGWCYTALPEAGTFDAGGHEVSIGGFAFSLRSVWVAPDHQAWAVSDVGHVLRWNGSGWTVETIASNGLLSIWGSSATDLWVTGARGLVLHGTVGTNGMSFEPVALETTGDVTRVWGRSASDVWVLADRVYHLETGGGAEPAFAAMDLPHGYEDPDAFIQYSSIWGDTNGVWVGGSETTYCDPVDCEYASQLFVTRYASGSWSYLALPLAETLDVPAGVTTSDGRQIAAVTGSGDRGFAVRIATDSSLLAPTVLPDGGVGEVSVSADAGLAWTQEQVESFGAPEGIWATGSKDVWLVGISGVVRHWDGANWQIGRLALTPQLPLLYNLHSIHGVVSPSGEQDVWIVGDDVALHRTVTP